MCRCCRGCDDLCGRLVMVCWIRYLDYRLGLDLFVGVFFE